LNLEGMLVIGVCVDILNDGVINTVETQSIIRKVELVTDFLTL
jgi:hypothetical protein